MWLEKENITRKTNDPAQIQQYKNEGYKEYHPIGEEKNVEVITKSNAYKVKDPLVSKTKVNP